MTTNKRVNGNYALHSLVVLPLLSMILIPPDSLQLERQRFNNGQLRLTKGSTLIYDDGHFIVRQEDGVGRKEYAEEGEQDNLYTFYPLHLDGIRNSTKHQR